MKGPPVSMTTEEWPVPVVVLTRNSPPNGRPNFPKRWPKTFVCAFSKFSQVTTKLGLAGFADFGDLNVPGAESRGRGEGRGVGPVVPPDHVECLSRA